MFTLLVFGTLWFWVAILVTLIWVSVLVEKDNGFGAFFVIAAASILLYIFGKGSSWSVIPWIIANPFWTLMWFALYFVAGAVWSIPKWYFKLQDLKRLGREKPLIGYYSQSFMRWIGYWPFSVIGFIFGDMIEKIVRRIAEKMSRIYQAMTDKVFGPDAPDVNHPSSKKR